MKRNIILVFVLFFSLTLYADYQQEYQAGQAAYKKGAYVSARKHFINVLDEKGIYANVVEYIKMCNEKVDEQNATNQLNAQNTWIAEKNELNQKVAEVSEKNIASAQVLSSARDSIQLYRTRGLELVKQYRAQEEELNLLKQTIGVFNEKITIQQHKIDSLQQAIAEMTKLASVPQEKTVAEIEQEIKNCKEAQKALEAEKKVAKEREKQNKSKK